MTPPIIVMDSKVAKVTIEVSLRTQVTPDAHKLIIEKVQKALRNAPLYDTVLNAVRPDQIDHLINVHVTIE